MGDTTTRKLTQLVENVKMEVGQKKKKKRKVDDEIQEVACLVQAGHGN